MKDFSFIKNKIIKIFNCKFSPIYSVYAAPENISKIIVYLQEQGFNVIQHQVQGDIFCYVCCTDGEFSALKIVLRNLDIEVNVAPTDKLTTHLIRKQFK